MSESKGMSIHDLYRLVLVSDPKVSPSGTKTVFTVTKMNKDKDKYESSIWLLDNLQETYEPITKGPSDKFPLWSPDGKKIAFISRRTMDEKEKGAEIWIYSLVGKHEPRMLLKLKGGIENVRWSPDGRKLLFLSYVGEPEEDVKVIERIPIWFNGIGYTYNLFKHLFVVDVYSGNYHQVTNGEINVTMANWCGDGRHIAYSASEDMLKPYISDIYLLDTKTGERERLTDGGFSIREFCCSPDGSYIALKGHRLEHGIATIPKIWILSVKDKHYENKYSLEYPAENSMNSDVRGPSSSPGLAWIGDHIYFHVAIRGTVHLYRMDIEGNYEPVIEGDLVVDNFSVSSKCIAATIMTSIQPPEVYLMMDGLKKVTSFNDSLLADVRLVKPEHFTFTASDGETIDGWIMKPLDFKEGVKYPTILEIHGGPATAYGEGFIHEFHCLTAKGFVVVFFNPRGSSGYRQEFRDIRGHYGEREYMDLMEGLDHALAKFNYIDGDRLGVTGGSYGGFMTNWIIGHTDRFKAAVTQRSICNWISKYGTTDIGFYFNADQIAGALDRYPWDEKWIEKYWQHSPLKYIGNAKTPTLIIHSIEDYRCWLDQAIQLFTALKIRGVDSRLVLFPNENHNLSRTGKPKHRIKRLEELIGWFEKYLK